MAKHDCFFGHCMQFHWGNDEISIYKLTPAGITHIDMLGTCVPLGLVIVSPHSLRELQSGAACNQCIFGLKLNWVWDSFSQTKNRQLVEMVILHHIVSAWWF